MTRTFLLILLLVAAVTGLLILSFNPNKTSEPKATAIPSPIQTILRLEESGVGTQSAKTINVKIDTGNNKVSSVQLELSYDPKLLTNVEINEGTFFENPVTLLKEINRKDGRISLALALSPQQGGVYGAGTVAVLSFEKLLSEGQTTINFLPKTVVSGEGVAKSVLKSATGLTLDLTQ